MGAETDRYKIAIQKYIRKNDDLQYNLVHTTGEIQAL